MLEVRKERRVGEEDEEEEAEDGGSVRRGGHSCVCVQRERL